MINKLPVLFLCALLGACSVSPLEYEASERLCASHGGVKKSYPSITWVSVLCKDGSSINQPKSKALYPRKSND